ncbi:MAG: hypothetical protein II842_16960 [Butyrivibrio sp.]|nr:hypothetical protein [Butyrivibrio sp.]
MELTGEEKNVLSAISFNSEGILNGDLEDGDKAMLTELRAVGDYLKDKYPGHRFEITGCEPKEGTARAYNEWYYRAEGITRDAAFIARAEEKDGKPEIKDDFYGEIIREEAAEEVKRLINGCGYKVALVSIDFCEYLGKEFAGKIGALKVLKGEIPAGNDIKIFVDGSGIDESAYDKTISEIEKSLKKAGVKGEIYVVLLKSADGDVIRDRLYSDSFALE